MEARSCFRKASLIWFKKGLRPGRFSAHQPVESRGSSEHIANPTIEMGNCAGRESGRPAIWNQSIGFTITVRAAKANRSSKRFLLFGGDGAHRKDRRDRRSAFILASQNRSSAQSSSSTWATHALSQQEQPGLQPVRSFGPSSACWPGPGRIRTCSISTLYTIAVN